MMQNTKAFSSNVWLMCLQKNMLPLNTEECVMVWVQSVDEGQQQLLCQKESHPGLIVCISTASHFSAAVFDFFSAAEFLTLK